MRAEEIDAEPSAEEAPRPAVDPKELDRYRRALLQLFARGQTFIARTASRQRQRGRVFTAEASCATGSQSLTCSSLRPVHRTHRQPERYARRTGARGRTHRMVRR